MGMLLMPLGLRTRTFGSPVFQWSGRADLDVVVALGLGDEVKRAVRVVNLKATHNQAGARRVLDGFP
jgi:hypothetical protein